MSNTNFTPGPWYRCGDANGFGIAQCGRGSSIATAYNRCDCSLIAAAPDMYAVLELCLEWIGDEANCTGECVYEEDGGMCLQCIVRSTLASARGEASQ